MNARKKTKEVSHQTVQVNYTYIVNPRIIGTHNKNEYLKWTYTVIIYCKTYGGTRYLFLLEKITALKFLLPIFFSCINFCTFYLFWCKFYFYVMVSRKKIGFHCTLYCVCLFMWPIKFLPVMSNKVAETHRRITDEFFIQLFFYFRIWIVLTFINSDIIQKLKSHHNTLLICPNILTSW